MQLIERRRIAPRDVNIVARLEVDRPGAVRARAKQVGALGDGDRELNFSSTERAFCGGPSEDDIFHLAATNSLSSLLSQYPSKSVNHV